MKKTIKQLEDHISYLEVQLCIERDEVVKLKAINDAYNRISLPITTMTIALERVTEAVAHVIADLKRK